MGQWIKKGVIPVVVFLLLWYLFKPVYMDNGTIDWFKLWLVMGIPFGITRFCVWFIPRNYDIGGTLGMFVLSVILSGIVGGVIAVITIVQAVFYLITYPIHIIFGGMKTYE